MVSFIAFGLDKFFAIQKHSRISEQMLLTFCLLGGVLGGALGMILFHHKVSKPKFRYTIPPLLLFYSIAFFMVIKNGIV